MKPQSTERVRFYCNGSATVGVMAVEKPHNEKPIGCYSTDLLREWADAIDGWNDSVYLWGIPWRGESDVGDMLAATPARDSNVAYVVAARRHDE